MQDLLSIVGSVLTNVLTPRVLFSVVTLTYMPALLSVECSYTYQNDQSHSQHLQADWPPRHTDVFWREF